MLPINKKFAAFKENKRGVKGKRKRRKEKRKNLRAGSAGVTVEDGVKKGKEKEKRKNLRAGSVVLV